MALKKKPVTGMKDILPREMEIRNYVMNMIRETYGTFGFSSIETPCVEHIENLCSKQGGENEKLIFKILRRKQTLWTPGFVTILQFLFPDIILIMQMSFLLLLKPFRWGMCGEQTARREDVSASLCSAILIF